VIYHNFSVKPRARIPATPARFM